MVNIPMRDVVCSRCVSDTTIPGIQFDARGMCNFCKAHDELERKFPLGTEGKQRLDQLLEQIKSRGKKKRYNCIVGVSGGRDSTYTLYMAKKLDLRPLAVHFDNGWDSEVASSNLRKAIDRLDVDLHTLGANWKEFKDLQRAFLEASVPDVSIPTDYVIISVLLRKAAELGIKYVLSGHSFRTEGLVPKGWSYIDGRYIKSIHKQFGRVSITSFPILSLSKLAYYILLKGIKYIPILQYLDYNQKDSSELIEKELDWKYYGGHHHESIYTHFTQSYLLPTKFGIDKRKVEYSALIRSGQMLREEALDEVNKPYPYDEEVVKFVIKQLGLTNEEVRRMYFTDIRSFRDYPTYYSLLRALKIPIRVACSLGLLPQIVYEKYLGGDQ